MMNRSDASGEVMRLAGQIVLEAPRPRGQFPARTTYVRRDLIERLEAALVAAGVNMPEARRLYREACKK